MESIYVENHVRFPKKQESYVVHDVIMLSECINRILPYMIGGLFNLMSKIV